MAEWSKAHDWKSCMSRKRHRGFESLSLHHHQLSVGSGFNVTGNEKQLAIDGLPAIELIFKDGDCALLFENQDRFYVLVVSGEVDKESFENVFSRIVSSWKFQHEGLMHIMKRKLLHR